ncbi:MAG: hypothetical protein K2Q26_07725 [Bdellovibrionales bacterium]|nr:hypothetical protein [Bdellovibrionales bacterium]
MKQFLLLISFGIFGLTLIQCSSGGGGGGAASSSFNGAYQALKQNLPGSSQSAMVLGASRANHSHFGATDWPLVGGGTNNNTGAQYVASLVDEDQEFSVLGRVKNSIMIACFLDLYGTKDSSRQIAVGSQTIKMKRSWGSSNCPGAQATMDYLFGNAPNIDSAGEIPLIITVTDISSDGVYQRRIQMDGDDNPQFGGSDQVMRIGVNGANVIFSHDESSSSPASRMTSFLEYTSSPELIRFQLSSKNSNVEQVYRFYINDATNAAALLAYDYYGSGSTVILTTLTSKANDLSQGTVSQTYTNYNGSSANGTNQEGCFNFDSQAFSNTNFGACNGITGISSNSASATMSTYTGISTGAMELTNTFRKTFDETTIHNQSVH